MFLIYCAAVLLFCSSCSASLVYPVSASWFRDRYSLDEWNSTLRQFKGIGGDTVFQRGPPLIRRSRADLQRDVNFVWCGSSSTGVEGTRCFDEAVQELSALGIKVKALVTYQYEENFSDKIMLCPKFDRKINSSRIYYRLVLPTINQSNPCNFTSGDSVVVLFTSFAGTDPHELLVENAATNNMSVFLGLPSVPMDYDHFDFDQDLMPAYYHFVDRLLQEHQFRYTEQTIRTVGDEQYVTSFSDVIQGYYSTDECLLAQIDSSSIYLNLYKSLGKMVHGVGKRFAVSPYVDLNRSQINATVTDHVTGFKNIVGVGVDVVAVQEGRGCGKGCYYWSNQVDSPVRVVDPKLDDIIHYLDPGLKVNVTFRQAFTASNQELFKQFGLIQDWAVKRGSSFEYWLNIEAFEYLRSDPCLPVDPMSSGMGELLQRTTKWRIDRALTVAGATPKKVISFAWDSDFTCITEQNNFSLAQEIRHDSSRPIIAECSFHSKDNLSVVVIGYNLDGETQGFTVVWNDKTGKRHTNQLNGYYFEMDWGIRHNKVPSLVYIMLWDIPEMNTDLSPKGIVTVKANNAYHDCVYEYDYS